MRMKKIDCMTKNTSPSGVQRIYKELVLCTADEQQLYYYVKVKQSESKKMKLDKIKLYNSLPVS